MRQMYEVVMLRAGPIHVLGDDVEDAAWQAVSIACEQDDVLLDVKPLNETP